MSMKKLAILSGHKYGLNSTDMYPTPGSPPAPVHGMNVMLGGAMLSGIILMILLYCYCCHKTHRKAQTSLPPYWRDPGYSLEIYTVEAQNCFGLDEFTNPDMHRPPTPGPPPAYDTVVPLDKDDTRHTEKSADDTGLPSYETAVQLQVAGNGYV